MFSDLQLRRRDIETLKRYVRQRLGGYRVRIDSITTDNVFYRGVKWSTRPSAIARVSYPPPECVTKLGRVNWEGQSMFY